MKLADQMLENRIAVAERSLLAATTTEKMREAHSQMAELIAKRTPQMVREMEQRKGLR